MNLMSYICLIALGIWIIIQLIMTRKENHERKTIGKLYIHEGEGKDTYSFAFDCQLEEVKRYEAVTLKIEVKNAKNTIELIQNMEQQL